MKETLTGLLKVKSIVTIILVSVYAVLALTNRIGSTEFVATITMVLGFYFGTQSAKKGGASE